MRSTLGFLLALTLIALPGGCPIDGIACTDIFAYGLTVRLRNSESGAAISGATLVLTEGAYVEALQELSPEFDPGAYVGAGERAGTYTLTIQAAGFESRVIEGIVITRDLCHVIGRSLDVELSPD